jgi:hypothetical protein
MKRDSLLIAILLVACLISGIAQGTQKPNVILKAGKYRITLRQFPKEVDIVVKAKRAKIKVAGKVQERYVEPGSKEVVFEMDLPEGSTEMITYLYNKEGKAGGAYFTEVEVL